VFEALTSDFEKKTEGVELYLSFHDSEAEGSRYDDVNGAFWCLGAIYQLTPQAKKLKKRVDFNEISYVQWG
jgi:hypothetical protein